VKCHSSSHKQPEQGFVLILVLVLLTIVSTILVIHARNLTIKAIDVDFQKNQLEQEWLWISCREFVLPKAEQLILDSESDSKTPHRARIIPLNAIYDNTWLVITDEQAKANINILYDRYGFNQTKQHLVSLLSQDVNYGITMESNNNHHGITHIQLINSDVDSAMFSPIHGLSSYRQIIRNDSIGYLWGNSLKTIAADSVISDEYRPPVDRFTLWGNGKLNFNRCDADALEIICHPYLDRADISKLMAIRNRVPGITFQKALSNVSRDEGHIQKLSGRVTNDSQTHAIWLITQMDPNSKSSTNDTYRAHFAVRQVTSEGETTVMQRW